MPKEHHARKRFGQNFLHDQNVIHTIVMAIAPKPSDTVIEIGPGLGALTLPILHKAQQLTAIELDRDIIPKLAAKCMSVGKLNIIEADVLNVDFSALANNKKLRIIGNLPYNISTPLLFHLMQFHTHIQDMHFMLQKEVVVRIAARSGTKAYGRLSVMMQFYCHVEPLFIVPPDAFSPAPKVDSMVVRLRPKPQLSLSGQNIEHLSQLVRMAFSQRRKTLANNLKGIMAKETIMACGIDPSRRAETLLLEEFVSLCHNFKK